MLNLSDLIVPQHTLNVVGGAKHVYTGNLATGDYCDSTTNDSTGEAVTICFNKGHAI